MLRRGLSGVLVAAGLLAAGLVVVPVPVASADGGICTEWGTCTVSGTIPGSAGSGSSGSAGSSSGKKSSGGKRVCRIDGREVPCSGDDGSWSSRRQEWCKKLDPQPPADDPRWEGKTEGAIYRCVRPTNVQAGAMIPDAGLATYEWYPSQEAVPQPPPDPAVMARRIVAGMGLKPVKIGSIPYAFDESTQRYGTVKVPVWLWIENKGVGVSKPVLASAAERGYTVTAKAEVVKVVWNLGDGSPNINCGVNGIKPGSAEYALKNSPACGRKTGYSKHGGYTITATSYWRVTWNGIGQSGVIELELEADPVDVCVTEIHTVITNGQPIKKPSIKCEQRG